MSLTHRLAYAPEHPAWRAAWPQLVADAAAMSSLAWRAAIPHYAGTEAGAIVIMDAGHTGAPLVLHANRPMCWQPPWPPHGCDLTEYADHGYVRVDVATGGASYSPVVAGLLLRAWLLAPTAVAIGSDSGWLEREWDTARGFATYVSDGLISRKLPDPLTIVAAGPPCVRAGVTR